MTNPFLFPLTTLGLGDTKVNTYLQRSPCTSQDTRNETERPLHSPVDNNICNNYDLGCSHDTIIFLDETGGTVSSVRVILVTISS